MDFFVRTPSRGRINVKGKKYFASAAAAVGSFSSVLNRIKKRQPTERRTILLHIKQDRRRKKFRVGTGFSSSWLVGRTDGRTVHKWFAGKKGYREREREKEDLAKKFEHKAVSK